MGNDFINLTNEDMLTQIDIDPRLVEIFKRVMVRMQDYFDMMGYSKERNYEDFFSKYILTKSPNKLKILCNSIPKSIGADGLYSQSKNIIIIDEGIIDNPLYAEHCLMHEFIHFLVMKNENELGNSEILDGGFVNEALTEELTNNMLPFEAGYMPQVELIRYANLLSGHVNDFSGFLKAQVDAKRASSEWNNFNSKANFYQKKFYDKGYDLNVAINDPDYILAQRYLISLYTQYSPKSIDEFLNVLGLLASRVAPDNEFVKERIEYIENNLISNIIKDNSSLRNLIRNIIDQIVVCENEINECKDDLYEIDFYGRKIYLDEKCSISGDVVYPLVVNKNNNDIVIKMDNKAITIDLRTIDFKKRKNDLISKKNDLINSIKNLKPKDMDIINSVTLNNSVESIQKHEIYNSSTSKFDTIYIGVYDDCVRVIDNVDAVGTVKNILQKCVDDKRGSYTDSITDGIVYPVLSEITLKSKLLNKLFDYYYDNMSNEDRKDVIDSYKMSEDYLLYPPTDPTKLFQEALFYYVNNNYDNIEDSLKKKLSKVIIDEVPRVVISSRRGEIEVSSLNDNVASNVKKTMLYDRYGDSLYQDFKNDLDTNRVIKRQQFYSTSIPIDGDGNIVVEKQIDNRLIDSFDLPKLR